MTPARGGPGTIKNGTTECFVDGGCLRSYNRRISCEALSEVRSAYQEQRLYVLTRSNVYHLALHEQRSRPHFLPGT